MVAPEIVSTDYGPRLVITGPWDPAYAALFREAGCKGLALHWPLPGPRDLAAPLAALPDLEDFVLVDHTIQDVSAIHRSTGLRHLLLDTYCKTAIDFARFPRLETCWLYWRPGAASVFDRSTLRRLTVSHYTGKDTAAFGRLADLESLAILTGRVESLAGLRSLQRLDALTVSRCTKLASLAGIEHLTGLRELELDTCRKLSAIDELASLHHLRKLGLLDLGDIASFAPLRRLHELEEVYFWESTNVVDGDLTPLAQLPALRKTAFQDRRHYSHRRADLPG